MFSQWLLRKRIARSAKALERIDIAKQRILSILDRERVAHEKTLEQKIAEQGPLGRRVDPHLISIAIGDMLELNRLAIHLHKATGDKPWYANIGTSASEAQKRINTLAPLYQLVSSSLSNQIGDALEVATFVSLRRTRLKMARYQFDGHFYLNKPKNQQGRFQSRPAQVFIGDNTTAKKPDFIQFGHDCGPLCIECKNYREWLYPGKQYIKWHILRCNELNAVPVFVVRRIHYSTMRNFFEPAGIIAHESYHQYFPSDQANVADQAKHKESLGFTDIIASEDPHPRTVKFFDTSLPKISGKMADRWFKNKESLVAYANDEINLSQLYTLIGSRAGGKWQEPLPEEEEWYPDDNFDPMDDIDFD